MKLLPVDPMETEGVRPKTPPQPSEDGKSTPAVEHAKDRETADPDQQPQGVDVPDPPAAPDSPPATASEAPEDQSSLAPTLTSDEANRDQAVQPWLESQNAEEQDLVPDARRPSDPLALSANASLNPIFCCSRKLTLSRTSTPILRSDQTRTFLFSFCIRSFEGL